MKQVKELQANGYYIFESLSSGKTVYFKSKEEIRIFKVLLYRYLHNYITIHKLFVDINGYHILLKIHHKRSLINNYRKDCNSKQKKPRANFLQEPWRIVSERIRIFHSTYSKTANKLRGREGVLVKKSYSKFYFEDLETASTYLSEMKEGKAIISQRNREYSTDRKESSIINWLEERLINWVKGFKKWAFPDDVLHKLICKTPLLHSTLF